MNLVPGVVEIDFTDWARGLIGAVISGGSNAVVAGFSVGAVDPKDFAIGSTNSFHVMGLMFLFSGVLGGAAFLAKRPVPDLKTVTKTVQTTEPQQDGAKVVSTVKETHQEPIDPKP
jgi:hypothetical protein